MNNTGKKQLLEIRHVRVPNLGMFKGGPGWNAALVRSTFERENKSNAVTRKPAALHQTLALKPP